MARRCPAGARSLWPGATEAGGEVNGVVSLASMAPVVPGSWGAGSTEGGARSPDGRKPGVALAGRAGCDPAGTPGMRVLVAFGDEYRSYREAIARAIQALRPSTRVTVTPLEAVPEQVYRLEPHVVICASRSEGIPDRNTTWVTVPTEEGVPGSISCGGFLREVGDLSLAELLTIVDEAEGSSALSPRDGDRPATP